MATLIQLVTIIRTKSVQGVSVVTWLLFGIANLCLYIYMEKYGEIQAILGLLGTAALNFAIVGLVVSGYGKEAKT